MEFKALNYLLHVLRENVCGKKLEREIDKMRNILSARQDLSACVEVLCQALSLTFTLRVTDQLRNLVAQVCDEALSWRPDPEQVLDAVDDFFGRSNLGQAAVGLIQSWLLSRAHDFQSAIQWAQDARKAAVNSCQPAQISWSRHTEGAAYCSMGCDAKKAGLLRKAETAFTRACILRRRCVLDWNNLGTIQNMLGKFSDALSAFNRALKVKKSEPQTWVGMATAYLRQGNSEEAKNVIQKGLAFSSAAGPLYHSLGGVLSRVGQSLSAIASYRQALSLGFKDSVVWCNLGLELEKIGQYEYAIASFRESTSLDPSSVEASVNIIPLFLRIKKLPIAADELKKLLESQSEAALVAPLQVARQFASVAGKALLKLYNLVAYIGLPDQPPGCGRHMVDRYLSTVQQALVDGLKIQELEPADVITGLLHIGMLWTLYAEKLPEKGLSKQFARERLYSIEHDIVETAPQAAKTSGFASAWPELEARMKTTSPEEFAREMLIQEPKWLQEVGEGQRRCEREDLRWRLQGNLWVHLYEYQREHNIEHLERAHYYVELLKGHTVLHKLADLRLMGSAIDVEKWNRYVNSLPVRVDRTAVVDLKSCTDMLPQNAIGLSFYFLKRELIPNLLLAFVFKPGQAPSIQIMEDGAERLGKYQEAANRLKHVHDQVAWRQKTPAIAEVFRKLTGQESERGQELVQAVAEWQKKQLVEAYKAILKGVVDEEELRGKDIYVSPSPEMYDIPFGLLCGDNGFLSNSARSITVVPIFSLKQFQRAGIFPHGPGFVLCLDENWQAEAKDRVTFLSDRWCNGRVGSEVERDLTLTGGKVEHIYDAWIRAMQGKAIIHVIGHHDASQWSRPTKSQANLGQCGRYLYEAPEKLSADVLALEACWAGTWSEPEDLMGLFVSLLASGVKWTIASPYSLVPTQTSRKLFENIYKQVVGRDNDEVGLDIARALRDAAEAVKKPAFSGDENAIPSLWGALQLYAAA
jgi:tetratricopeptide (TPR) repeat protein